MVVPLMVHSARQSSFVRSLLAIAVLVVLVSCRQPDSRQEATLAESLIIPVSEDGFYRLSFEALRKAGIDLSRLDDQLGVSRLPRLSHEGVVVPLLRLDDSLVFYGMGPSSRYATYRAYILDTRESGPAMELENRPIGQLEELASVPFSEEFEENNFYDGRPYEGLAVDPATRDPWFWETIQAGGQVTVAFDLAREPVQPATLELGLVGVSSNDGVNPDHDLDLSINGRALGTVHWDGETAASLPVSVPEGVLRKGTNSLLLDNSAPGAAPIDIARLDRLTVTYNAGPVAVNGRLETQGVRGAFLPAGFRDRPLLFDISQPDTPAQLAGQEDANGQISVALDSGTKLYAVDRDSLLVPEAMNARGPAILKVDERQADLIIISSRSFISALEPLAEHRRIQGISVTLVALEQIYEEFADAGIGPPAITAFLTYATNHWLSPQPSYLLLVGDASIDYRDYLGQRRPSLVPAPVVPVKYSGETVSDARLADVDGDRRPDLAVGRWPAAGVDEVTALVKRTIDDEGAAVSPRVIFAADGTEPRFAEMNAAISLQASLQSRAVYLNGPTSRELGQAWKGGAWIVTYTGHGSLDRWGKETLLDTDSVSALSSTGMPPIVLQLTCLTGLFAHPTIPSLSETMLRKDDGPVAIVAATSLTLSEDQQPFGVALLQALQDPDIQRVGDAVQWAKSRLDIEASDALREISDTFTLFGDPSALIRRPAG
jgi:hypothetical protein